MLSKIVDFFTHEKEKNNRRLMLIVLIMSLIATYSAFILSVDAIELLKNPDAALSCDINAIISCGTVAKTDYASMFGFPNSFIGMMAEPVFAAVAIMFLMGAKVPRRFMFALQLGAVGSFVFAVYLFFIAAYAIGALCPWCLTVDVVTVIMTIAITRFNILNDNLYLSRDCAKKAKSFIEKDYDKLIAASLIVLGAVVVIAEFGNRLFS